MPNSSNPSAATGGVPSGAPKTPLQDQTLAQLYAGAAALKAIISAPADVPTYQAANDSYGLIQDRISTVLNLQLAGDTDAMQKCAPALNQAKADLDAVLKNISKASDLVDGVSKYLGVVDDFIAVAEKAATLI
jgi:hypothetical protein